MLTQPWLNFAQLYNGIFMLQGRDTVCHIKRLKRTTYPHKPNELSRFFLIVEKPIDCISNCKGRAKLTELNFYKAPAGENYNYEYLYRASLAR